MEHDCSIRVFYLVLKDLAKKVCVWEGGRHNLAVFTGYDTLYTNNKQLIVVIKGTADLQHSSVMQLLLIISNSCNKAHVNNKL